MSIIHAIALDAVPCGVERDSSHPETTRIPLRTKETEDGDVVSFTQRRQKATSGVELVRVRDSEGMLPRMQDVLANLFDAYPVFHLRKHERTATAHLLRIPAHYVEICADGLRKIGLINDK